MTFKIASTILQPLHDHVLGHGLRDAEAGGFLLGSGRGTTADILALAEGAGVERSRGLFRISGLALERLFAWAEGEDVRIWAQVHSHPRGSFLSETDETHGFRVRGFTSAVIPDYTHPPLAPDHWGWWAFVDDVWRTIGSPRTVEAASRVIAFSEGGVR